MKSRVEFPMPFASLRTISGGREGAYVMGAMFTPNYAAKANRLAASCEKFGVPHVLHEVAAIHRSISTRGSRDLSVTKANFIRHLLDTHAKPVLYVDADCEFLEEPGLIEQLARSACDFAIYNWFADEHNDAFAPIELSIAGGPPIKNRYYAFSHWVQYFSADQLFCSGPVQLYGNSEKARLLLSEWFRTIESFPGVADDECLDFTFNNLGEKGHGLRTHWLPKSYARYSWWIYEKPIINHPDLPSMDGNFVDIEDPAGKQRFYVERARLRNGAPLFPRDCIIDTEQRMLYRMVGTQMAPIGRTEREFWL
jgi:hypothetical protein